MTQMSFHCPDIGRILTQYCSNCFYPTVRSQSKMNVLIMSNLLLPFLSYMWTLPFSTNCYKLLTVFIANRMFIHKPCPIVSKWITDVGIMPIWKLAIRNNFGPSLDWYQAVLFIRCMPMVIDFWNIPSRGDDTGILCVCAKYCRSPSHEGFFACIAW